MSPLVPVHPGPPSDAIPGHVKLYSGKVRDLYARVNEAGEPERDRILLVASDRISAYDHILASEIPHKGEVLTRMSLWWFDQLRGLVPNHVLSTDVPKQVAGRGIYVKALRMLPVECVARAYLTGGGLAEYKASGTVSHQRLPEGLVDASRLTPPLFTPSSKAPQGEHDEPISYEQVVDLVGPHLAERLRDLTVAILSRGNEIAAERGLLIADTKVEFGLAVKPEHADTPIPQLQPEDYELVLADEVLTPDSSRFWSASEWSEGQAPSSFDKQFVRDWLTSGESGWDRHGDAAPPALPGPVVNATKGRYVAAFEALTGETFVPLGGR